MFIYVTCSLSWGTSWLIKKLKYQLWKFGYGQPSSSARGISWPSFMRSIMWLQLANVAWRGLDFNRDFSPRDQRRDCFAAHLELAARNGMPMFLYERDAFDEFYAMMSEA